MRERLIELINFAFNGVGAKKNANKTVAEIVADYLLEHGVIVPPCKVGDYVEWASGISKQLYPIRAFYYEPSLGLRVDLGLITPIVSHEAIIRFVPKEEAEQALKEGDQE